MALLPQMKWAQRKDKLFVTIDVQDCKDPSIELDDSGKLSFRGHAHSHATGPDEHAYVCDLELCGEIVKEDSKQAVTDRTITLVIAKKEEGHWPRLLKAAGKSPQHIKVDWDKWVDEDEEDEAEAGGMPPGFDMSQMQSMMGGMGGMGGGGMGGLEAMMGGMGGMMGGGMGGGANFGGAELDSMDFGAGGDLEGDDSDDEDLPPLEPTTAA